MLCSFHALTVFLPPRFSPLSFSLSLFLSFPPSPSPFLLRSSFHFDLAFSAARDSASDSLVNLPADSEKEIFSC